MNACPHLPDISALKDSELPPRDERRLRLHLQDCAHCAAEWKRLETLSALLQQVPVDHGAEERIRRSVRRRQAWYRRPLPLPSGIAAALLLALGLSLAANLWLLAPGGQQAASPDSLIEMRTLPAQAADSISVVTVEGVPEFSLTGLKGMKFHDRPKVRVVASPARQRP